MGVWAMAPLSRFGEGRQESGNASGQKLLIDLQRLIRDPLQ
jgi:hypothetical protein